MGPLRSKIVLAKEIWTRLAEAARHVCGDTTLSDENRALIKQNENLKARVSELEERCNVDPLTGLNNRTGAARDFTKLEKTIRRTNHNLPKGQQKEQLFVCMIDLDKFKDFNERAGHAGGDAVLKIVAETLKQNLNRPMDFAGRWSGDEFVIGGPCHHETDAIGIAERVRKAISELSIKDGKGEVMPISGSFGVVVFDPAEGLSLNGRMRAASYVLKTSKNLGRNAVSKGAALVEVIAPNPPSKDSAAPATTPRTARP